MLFKMLQNNVSSKYTRMIMAIYKDVKTCIKTKINLHNMQSNDTINLDNNSCLSGLSNSSLVHTPG